MTVAERARDWRDVSSRINIRPATFISTTTKEAGLACFSTTMATHKVKIAARLRPKIESEIDDDSVKIVHPSNDSGGSSSSTSGGSFITVANPRDPTQIFKFPYVYTNFIFLIVDVFT